MKITLTNAGPVGIKVNHESVLLSYGEKGKMINLPPHSETWACTCGKSKNYPDCDGSHNQPVITTTSEYPLLS